MPKSLFFGLSILFSVQKKVMKRTALSETWFWYLICRISVSRKFIYNGCIAVIGDAGTGVLLWMVQWFSEYGENKCRYLLQTSEIQAKILLCLFF